jgi:hypothetical protein
MRLIFIKMEMEKINLTFQTQMKYKTRKKITLIQLINGFFSVCLTQEEIKLYKIILFNFIM